MMESGLLLWGVREGHWLLPIWGGAVSKTRLATCRGVDGTQGTTRDMSILLLLLFSGFFLAGSLCLTLVFLTVLVCFYFLLHILNKS